MPDAAFPVAVLAGRQAAPFAEHPGEIELIREARRECCFADRRLRIGAPVLFGFFEAALDQQFLEAGLVVAAEEFEDRENLTMHEVIVGKNHKWKNKTLAEIPVPAGTLVVMISRGGETIIPKGNTVIQEGDTMVVAKF